MSRFEDLPLIEPLIRAVREEGYAEPTPIQEKTIRHALEGRDVLGCAQTGTGKTAAFALPILQRLHATPAKDPRPVRAVVLAPTRELASQIGESFARYGRHTGLRHTTIYGGVSQRPQALALRKGVDVVIATPGRLLDLIQRKAARVERVEVLVLDEADRMLDMGFIREVRRVIAALPRERQTLFFSATLPHDIKALARDILRDPVRIDVAPTATPVAEIAQSLYAIRKDDKFALLARLLRDPEMRRVLVFARTKRGAGRLEEQLRRDGIQAAAIHGNKGQTAREKSLEEFRSGAARVLVATDIASRGLDVDDVTHVVNYDLPDLPENYVHRIGRTARAGARGAAITFCTPGDRETLAAIEALIRMAIPKHPLPPDFIRAVVPERAAPPRPPGAPHGRGQAHPPRRPGAPGGRRGWWRRGRGRHRGR